MGKQSHVGRVLDYNWMRVTSARRIRRLALPKGRVWIRQKSSQKWQIIKNAIIDGGRCWMNNTLK